MRVPSSLSREDCEPTTTEAVRLAMQARVRAQSIIDRLEPITESGCLIWTGATSKGYGQVSCGGKLRYVHQVLYEICVGPVTLGMEIDHLCRVRCCANIEHLELVTPKENKLRGVSFSALNAKKTHCIRGHVLEGDNLLTRKRFPTWRLCKLCSYIHGKRNRDKRIDGHIRRVVERKEGA